MTPIATPSATLNAPARAVGLNDRLFFGTIAVVMGATVLIGFAATYYLRLLDGGPKVTLTGGPFTTLVHIHAALFTSWMLLFIVQTALISTRRVAVHRRLGVAGAVLAAAMVAAGLSLAVAATARAGAGPVGMTPFAFLAIPVFDMVMFSGFVTTALVMRKNKEAHKRLMLLAYVSLITAAIARLPGVLTLGPPVFFAGSLLFVVAGMIYDFVSRGRVHRAYLWGGALLAISVPLRLAIGSTGAWQSFAKALTRLAS